MSDERDIRSAAAVAADQVRAIVEAAERENTDRLRRVQGATESLGARADEIEEQLERLAEGVREAIGALRADLARLRAESVTGPERRAPEPGPIAVEPESRPALTEPATPEPAPAAAEPTPPEPAPSSREAAPRPASTEPSQAEPAAGQPAAEAPAPVGRAPSGGVSHAAPPGSEGARVIALNMALGGSSREETAAYLAENFVLDDPEGLLDDVYARAAG